MSEYVFKSKEEKWKAIQAFWLEHNWWTIEEDMQELDEILNTPITGDEE